MPHPFPQNAPLPAARWPHSRPGHQLPAEAQRRLRTLRDLHADAAAISEHARDGLDDARSERDQAQADLARLRDADAAGFIPRGEDGNRAKLRAAANGLQSYTIAGPEPDMVARIEAAERRLEAATEALIAAQERYNRASTRRAAIAKVIAELDRYLANLPAGATLQAIDREAKPKRGEDIARAIERHRSNISNYKADIARLEAAPRPLAERAAAIRRRVAELVEEATVGVDADQVAERGFTTARWPLKRLDITTISPTAEGSSMGRGVTHVVDVVGVLAWLFPDQLADRLVADLEDTGEELTEEERLRRLADLEDALWASELDEASLTFQALEAGAPTILPRADIAPAALLGIEVTA